MDEIAIRCPRDARRILFKIRNLDPDSKAVIEIACESCKTGYRKSGLVVGLVLHSYDAAGVLTGTEVVPAR